MIEELQSFTTKGNRTKKGGPRKLNADELDRLWDEVQALRAGGLGWRAPTIPSQPECQNPPLSTGCTQS